MVDLQMRRNDQNEKMRKLRSYLKQNQVDNGIAHRVNRQAMIRIDRKEILNDGDVSALELLSSPLRTELRYDICRPHLMSNSLCEPESRDSSGFVQFRDEFSLLASLGRVVRSWQSMRPGSGAVTSRRFWH